jgi:hypothetical protein
MRNGSRVNLREAHPGQVHQTHREQQLLTARRTLAARALETGRYIF